jgi:AGCS family alanine or glycine:cation symporter
MLIKRFVLAALMLLLFIHPITSQSPNLATAEPTTTEATIDDQINAWMQPATDVISNIVFYPIDFTDTISVPFILIWLLVGATFFTVYLGFINIRGFKKSLKIIKGTFTKPTDPGQTTHFQALTAALSGTVGLGNIAGVAIAISMGGPGATVWMILAGFLGMTSKFTECTLAVKYRDIEPDGTVNGGPMYYLKRGFSEKGIGGFGKVLAVFFAVMCIGGSFGGGNMFQVNQAAQQFVSLPLIRDTFLADSLWIFGAIMAVLVAIVILGGITSIVKVTEKIVPFMCGIYVLGALVVIGANFGNLPTAIEAIFDGAFSGTAVAGGIVGAMIQGIRRAAFSNEAGVGSAAIAHSTVKTGIPVTEGFVASLEPFIDTVVVCTMTALVIIITGNYTDPAVDGIALTSNSFATVISWFPLLLSVAVILFAFSTMISWSFYGLKSWTYLFGNSKASELSYKAIFCVFVILGSALSLGAVTDFSDAMIFAMSFPNMIGMYFLAPVVKREMNAFLKFADGKEDSPLPAEQEGQKVVA